MAINILSNIALAAFRAGITPRTNASRTWFRQQAAKLGRVNRNSLMKGDDVELSGRELIGSMQMYFYQPKHANSLKYYDRFPLVLVFDFKPNGFIGCNMHYLPPLLRAKLMDEIDKAKGINWKALSKIKEIKPTVKRYLYKHISSKVVEIEDDEREIALFLPTERFKKEDKLVVWGDSRRMI